MPDSIIVQFVSGLGGALVLFILYRAIETNWPSSYYTTGDVVSRRVSKTPVGYAAFRFFPILLVAFFVAASLTQADHGYLWALLVLGLAHYALTNGRAMIDLLRHGRRQYGFVSLLILHVATAAAMVVALAVAGLAVRIPGADQLVPDVAEIPISLWTAAAAGIIAAYVVRISHAHEPDVAELTVRSRNSIGPELLKTAHQAAAEHDIDPLLMESIMLTENLQRPGWVRQFERLLGKLTGRPGTYGIMQVNAPKPLSDADSIWVAAREHLEGARPVHNEYDDPDTELVEGILSMYNPDAAFTGMARDIYMHLSYEA